MIECHPLLHPVVRLAKPAVHAARGLHRHVVGVGHNIHHHVHRVLTAVTPPQGIMTVCVRAAGPVIATGLVMLPPGSAVPPAGYAGGFPGAAYPEYGAPAFGSAFVGPTSFPSGSGESYGPAVIGAGAVGPGPITSGGFVGPQVPGGSSGGAGLAIIASERPFSEASISFTAPPSFSVPAVSPLMVASASETTVPGGRGPSTGDVSTTGESPPSIPTGHAAGGGTPLGSVPETPVNTPEPASIAVIASALGGLLFARLMSARRRRNEGDQSK